MIDSYKTEYPEVNQDRQVILDNGLVVFDCTVTEKGIKGFIENTDTQTIEKAYYNNSKSTWYFGSNNIQKANLVNLKDRTIEERKHISSLGVVKSQQRKEAKKSLNDIAKCMLDTQLSTAQVKKLLGVEELPDYLDENNSTVGAMLIIKGLQGALVDGSFKWAEFVRDTAGYKPKNEVDISADIMTDADRQLMENIQKRLG